jgi:hypothetical protein
MTPSAEPTSRNAVIDHIAGMIAGAVLIVGSPVAAVLIGLGLWVLTRGVGGD